MGDITYYFTMKLFLAVAAVAAIVAVSALPTPDDIVPETEMTAETSNIKMHMKMSEVKPGKYNYFIEMKECPLKGPLAVCCAPCANTKKVNGKYHPSEECKKCAYGKALGACKEKYPTHCDL